MEIEVHNELTGGILAEWRGFLREARHQHPRQDPRFAVVEQVNGNIPLYVLGRQNGRVCAIGIFSLRPSSLLPGRYASATALSGPVCDDTRTMISFLSALSKNPAFTKVGALSITPYWLGDEAVELSSALVEAGWRVSEAEVFRHTGVIDLTLPEEKLRASFSRSARRKIKAVEREDITIREIHDPDEAHIFFDRLDRFILSRHSLTPIDRPERQAIFGNICQDPEMGVLLGAFQHGDFLGGFLIYRSNRTAHAARYVADLDNAKLRVASSLWFAGMLWAKRQGCTVMDVEGYKDVSDMNHPKFNIYEYKRQFHPRHIQRIAEHMLPLNRFVHAVEQGPQRVRQIAKSVMAQGKK